MFSMAGLAAGAAIDDEEEEFGGGGGGFVRRTPTAATVRRSALARRRLADNNHQNNSSTHNHHNLHIINSPTITGETVGQLPDLSNDTVVSPSEAPQDWVDVSGGGGGKEPTSSHSHYTGDDDEWDLESERSVISHTERSLMQLLALTNGMRIWRARLFLLINSGNLIPLRSIDVHAAQEGLDWLDPISRARMIALKLANPFAILRLLLFSKSLTWIFTGSIVLSVILLCISTETHWVTDHQSTLFILDSLCTLSFTIEIILGFLCLRRAPRRKVWQTISIWSSKLGLGTVFGPNFASWVDDRAEKERQAIEDHEETKRILVANSAFKVSKAKLKTLEAGLVSWQWLVVDVVATLPFYVEIALALSQSLENIEGFNGFTERLYAWNGVTGELRFLRLLRVLRLFKIVQKSEKLRFMIKAMSISTDGIWLLIYMMMLSIVLFSALVFFAEQSEEDFLDGQWVYKDGTISPFQSIIGSFWLTITTITTTGYGDIIPHTSAGKIVMSASMLCSIFIIAFPLSMITLQYGHVVRLFMIRKEAHEREIKNVKARQGNAPGLLRLTKSITGGGGSMRDRFSSRLSIRKGGGGSGGGGSLGQNGSNDGDGDRKRNVRKWFKKKEGKVTGGRSGRWLREKVLTVEDIQVVVQPSEALEFVEKQHDREDLIAHEKLDASRILPGQLKTVAEPTTVETHDSESELDEGLLLTPKQVLSDKDSLLPSPNDASVKRQEFDTAGTTDTLGTQLGSNSSSSEESTPRVQETQIRSRAASQTRLIRFFDSPQVDDSVQTVKESALSDKLNGLFGPSSHIPMPETGTGASSLPRTSISPESNRTLTQQNIAQPHSRPSSAPNSDPTAIPSAAISILQGRRKSAVSLSTSPQPGSILNRLSSSITSKHMSFSAENLPEQASRPLQSSPVDEDETEALPMLYTDGAGGSVTRSNWSSPKADGTTALTNSDPVLLSKHRQSLMLEGKDRRIAHSNNAVSVSNTRLNSIIPEDVALSNPGMGSSSIGITRSESEHPSHPHHHHYHHKKGQQQGHSVKEVERLVRGKTEGTPAKVHIRVADWRLDYDEKKREDVLRMRIDCKDEETYRRLMRTLAELS